VTKRNLKWQKRPKTHQFLPLWLFYQHFSANSNTKINKFSTTFFTRIRTSFCTKHTFFGYRRNKPATSCRKCPKHSNSSTKRPINRIPSFKTNNAPRKPSNVRLPANPWNIFWRQWQQQRQTTSSALGLPRCPDIIYKNRFHLPTNWRPHKNAPKVCQDHKLSETELSNWPSFKTTTIQYLHGQSRHCLQHFTLDKTGFWPQAKTNQLFSSMHWYSNLQLDHHEHQWSLPETHYWLSTRCQNRNPDSETSLCTAHSRSRWTHAQRLLLHLTRTARICNIILDSHLNANVRLSSCRNPKHRRWNNQTNHLWRQQPSLLCCILSTIQRRHPSSQIKWWRPTTFCRTWEPPIEHWQITWTNFPLPKPAELQSTCKLRMPIPLESHFSTLSRYHTYFHITSSASLRFNNATIHLKQQQTAALT
jgi:hypothetical protein